MNRRLYFVLPSVESAHTAMNDMLLARINADHIHFLAKPEVALEGLPEASVLERSDMLNGLKIGSLLGTVLGFLAGLLAVLIPPWPFNVPVPMVAIPICALIGLLAGGLWTSLVATSITDAKLDPFKNQLAHGEVLMMILVPFHRTKEIRELVAKSHPEADYGITWPTEHAIFP